MEENPPTGTRVVPRQERGRIEALLVEEVLDEEVGPEATIDLADPGREAEEGGPVDGRTRVAGRAGPRALRGSPRGSGPARRR